MAKVIEFYVREFFSPRARRISYTPGQVIDFTATPEAVPLRCLCGIVNIESWKRMQEGSIPEDENDNDQGNTP